MNTNSKNVQRVCFYAKEQTNVPLLVTKLSALQDLQLRHLA